MSRLAPDERRQQILRAAAAAVTEVGFGRVTVRRLADELEVSPGLLHHYFDSVDEAVEQAFALLAADTREELDHAIDPRADPAEQLAQLIDYVVPEPDDRASIRWLEATAEATRNPALRTPVNDLNEHFHHLIVAIINQGLRTQAFTCDQPETTARLLGALLAGVTINVTSLRAQTRDEARALLHRTCDTELGTTYLTAD
jgi:AcrR family transcriptional regulator